MSNDKTVSERKNYFKEDVIAELQSISRRCFGLAMVARAKLVDLMLEMYDNSTGNTHRDRRASNFSQIPELFKTKTMQRVYHISPLKYSKLA